MNQNKTATPPMNVGISLLLVVFLILCLFTFAAIALTSAKNEYENSLDVVQRTGDYYAACNEVEQILAALQADIDAGRDQVLEVRNYNIPINREQQLCVSIEPVEPGSSEPYRIIRWQTTSTINWQTDDTVNVLTPQLIQ